MSTENHRSLNDIESLAAQFSLQMQTIVERTKSEMSAELRKLRQEKEALEARSLELEKSMQKVNIILQQNDSLVVVNVGGTLFRTSTHTLAAFPQSVLAILTTQDFPVDKDESGAIFIDRNPVSFEYILNFCRKHATREMSTPSERIAFCEQIPPEKLTFAIEDAAFYGLCEMEDALRDLVQRDQVLSFVPERQSSVSCEFMVLAMAIADGWIYVGLADGGFVSVYAMPQLHEVHRVAAHSDYVTGMLIRGDQLVTSSRDRTVKVWDRHEMTQLASYMEHTDYVQDLFQTKSGRICTVSQDRTMRVWDIPKDREAIQRERKSPVVSTHTFDNPGKCGVTHGNLCFVACTTIINVFDTETGTPFAPLTANDSHVRCLAISERTGELVSGAWDKTLRFFPLDGVEVQHGTGRTNPVQSRIFKGAPGWIAHMEIKGATIIFSTDAVVVFLDAFSLSVLREVHTGHSDVVRCFLLDDATNKLITGSFDRFLRVFGTKSA